MNACLFIGMPVFNGEMHLASAIDSLRKQSFQNWKILISDNHSQDGTEAICNEYSKNDERISYFRHESNIGAVDNFLFVLQKSDAEFFMWMAHDDVWIDDALERCMDPLLSGKSDYAFGLVENVTPSGEIFSKLSGLRRFRGKNRYLFASRYILSAESDGKANLVYGIFRKSLLRAAENRRQVFKSVWGADMIFVFSVLSTARRHILSNVALQKRLSPSEFKNIGDTGVKGRRPYYQKCCSADQLQEFCDELGLAAEEKGGVYHMCCRVLLTLKRFLFYFSFFVSEQTRKWNERCAKLRRMFLK